MNEQADQPATPGTPAANPGLTLRAAREAMGWHEEQVADQLKLSTRQIVALEAGDFAALPSPAVTRGFVRAYAKLMRIDPAPLVALIAMDIPAEAQAGVTAVRREARPTTFSETRFPMGGKRSRAPLVWGAAALVIAGALIAAWQLDLLPHAPAVSEPAVEQSPADELIVPALVTTDADAHADASLHDPSVPLISVPGQTPSVAPAPALAGTVATPSVATPSVATPGVATSGVVTPSAATPGAVTPGVNVAPAAVQPAPVAAPVPSTVVPPAVAAGANGLVLDVRADSWIEVRPSAGGRPLISRLVKAGSTETVDVTGPMTLVVGVPGAVNATLRGQPVTLTPMPGKTLARVSLK